MNQLQKAEKWQKELDKAVESIVYEDAYSFIKHNSSLKTYEVLLHCDSHAVVIGSGSFEGCHRVALKILKNPQYKKTFLACAGL